jgi:hypothetical protein
MFEARLGMAAGAKFKVPVAAEVVPKDGAHKRKNQAEQKTAKINILFHRRVLSMAAGRCLSSGI